MCRRHCYEMGRKCLISITICPTVSLRSSLALHYHQSVSAHHTGSSSVHDVTGLYQRGRENKARERTTIKSCQFWFVCLWIDFMWEVMRRVLPDGWRSTKVAWHKGMQVKFLNVWSLLVVRGHELWCSMCYGLVSIPHPSLYHLPRSYARKQ